MSTFPAFFNLTDLNGSNGFVTNGINSQDQSGVSVSGAGDINGDPKFPEIWASYILVM